MSKAKRKPASPPSKKRRSTWPLVIAGAVVVSILIAIAASVGNESDSGPGATGRDPATVAAGAELFAASCAVCHGADLLGSATGPPFLHPYYAPNHHSDEAFQRAVALGVVPHHWDFGPMQPLAHLTREDVAKIIAFVRTEQEAAGIYQDPSH
jgi:mono/diheme cytochrome c family protein